MTTALVFRYTVEKNGRRIECQKAIPSTQLLPPEEAKQKVMNYLSKHNVTNYELIDVHNFIG